MSDLRQHEIVQRMHALRSEGAWAAAQLPRDIDRATDWREHVRAHPIPAVLAAAALGFTLVPGRSRSSAAAAPRGSGEPAQHGAGAAASSTQRQAAHAQAAAREGGLSYYAKPVIAALSAWAGRVAIASATGALQRLATENLQSLPSSFMKHGSAPPQRRGETGEHRRVYND